MKKEVSLILALIFVLLIATFIFAQAQEDIQKHPSCKYCGMDRKQFVHTRILIEYDDASTVGTCSIHCAAIDLALNIDKTPKAVRVGETTMKRVSSTLKRHPGSLAETRWVS